MIRRSATNRAAEATAPLETDGGPVTAGVRELRDHRSRSLDLVRDGTSVTVADHGVPIGTILPMRFTERTMELDRQGRGTLPKADASAFRLTEVDAAVVAGAGELAAWHGLAALDAIHLGSAADVATGTRPFAFVTFDRRLAAAALAEGLTALPEVA